MARVTDEDAKILLKAANIIAVHQSETVAGTLYLSFLDMAGEGSPSTAGTRTERWVASLNALGETATALAKREKVKISTYRRAA